MPRNRSTRRHHLLLAEQFGQPAMETLCNRLVFPIRGEINGADQILAFASEAGNQIQCVFDARDVSCNTCAHVWRNIRGRTA